MAISYVTSAAASGTSSTATTSSVDTTGADLLVVGVSCDSGVNPVVSDNKGNKWVALGTSVQGAAVSQMYYASNATVGSGHTFTASNVSSFPAISMVAFSGTDHQIPFDKQSGTVSSGPTAVFSSITPSINNSVLVTHLCINGAGLPISIDSGFTKTATDIEFGPGNNYGSGIAYLIQTTASAVAPTWTRTNSTPMAARLAIFEAEVPVSTAWIQA